MSDWFQGRRGSRLAPAFETLQDELARVFTDLGFSPPGTQGAVVHQPKVDVISTERGGIEVHVELPGVDEKDIDLTVDGNLLTIRGERRTDREESRRNYRLRERAFGAFSRSIALPFEPDPGQVDAEYRHGVLVVRVERPQPNQGRGARVPIRSGTGSGGGAFQSGPGGPGQSSGATGGQTNGPTGGQTGQTSGMLNEGGTADTSRSGGMLGEGG
jgi:HSP20 family protein